MVETSLKSHKFRLEREAGWKQLEDLLAKLERRSLRSLSDAEMIALPGLYRAALSSLNVARATSLDQDVIAYLENLSTRAYFAIYGSQVSIWKRIARFFSIVWPKAVQSLWRETLVSGLVMLLGVLLAYFLVRQNMDWYFHFVPEGMMGGRSPAATTEELRQTLYDNNGVSGLSFFASFLFSHNSRIAIMAFALGFAFALPSIFLMLYNGLILGAFLALFAEKGLGFEVGGWLFIHGTTEMFAITLAGATGIKIGWAVAFPGENSRADAAARAGVQAATVMGGVIVMLFCAGLLEGFGRQLITSDLLRYSIGFIMLLLWLAYFYLPRDAEVMGFEGWEEP
ncbi:MAG TPA: stage II sporulation protein M [Hellea balneolensis]|uniref:Stage II sporulation protein M n=1 Tax=Hellea balneolensis TaxID=287478 RepID=A0A7V5U135_9PROT|nr:stage II sporulation protein M [Hellea balneolensis]